MIGFDTFYLYHSFCMCASNISYSSFSRHSRFFSVFSYFLKLLLDSTFKCVCHLYFFFHRFIHFVMPFIIDLNRIWMSICVHVSNSFFNLISALFPFFPSSTEILHWTWAIRFENKNQCDEIWNWYHHNSIKIWQFLPRIESKTAFFDQFVRDIDAIISFNTFFDVFVIFYLIFNQMLRIDSLQLLLFTIAIQLVRCIRYIPQWP